jgi:hypothetical protein
LNPVSARTRIEPCKAQPITIIGDAQGSLEVNCNLAAIPWTVFNLGILKTAVATQNAGTRGFENDVIEESSRNPLFPT